MRMRDAVRLDARASLLESTQVVPGHGAELLGIVALELGNGQGSPALVGEAAARKDRHGQTLGEDGVNRRLDAAEGVVECDVNGTEAPDRAHLSQEQLETQGEPVLPRRRDRVVAEN